MIFTFSEHHVETAVNIIGLIEFFCHKVLEICQKKLIIVFSCYFSCSNIPWFGPMLQSPFKEWFKSQKAKLRVTPGEEVVTVKPHNCSIFSSHLCYVFVVCFSASEHAVARVRGSCFGNGRLLPRLHRELDGAKISQAYQ